MDILEKRALFHAGMKSLCKQRKILLIVENAGAVVCFVLSVYHAWIGNLSTAMWGVVVSLLCFILACKDRDYIHMATKLDDATRILDRVYDVQEKIKKEISKSEAEAGAEAEPQNK